MDTKALVYGIIGFILGGLLVAIAATSFNQTADGTIETSTKQRAQ